MGQKDISEKTLESYNDVFSDIVNVLLFDGQLIVQENELTDAVVTSQYKIEDDKLHQQERDVAKFWNKGDIPIRICLYGFENQTVVDSDMPLRIIGYDGASYRSQLLDKNSKKNQERFPVVTLVLYFGFEHWKKRSLLESVKVPEILKPYVSDYKINVFEIAWLDMATVQKFKSDFKIVAEYFVNMRQKNTDYIPSNDTLKHVDEILKLMNVLTGDKDYIEIQKSVTNEEKQGGVSMCELLKSWRNSGIALGEQRGIALGEQRGIKLAQKLISEGRQNELLAAMTSTESFEALFNKEFANK